MDYRSYFSLQRKPFENLADPSFHYQGYEHVEAIERLLYIIEEGNMNFGLLTGEIGCGKSMTRKVMQERLSPMDYQVVALENCNLPFQYLLMYINKQLGGKMPDSNSPQAELFFLFEEFKRLYNMISRRSMSLVLFLDEAQQLSPEDLTEFKNLTNIEVDGESTITIILMGQPELREMIQDLPPLDQRISLRFHLNHLQPREVGEYIQHRLRIAGHPTGQIFAEDATALISNASRGIPREINRVCNLALDHAFSLNHANITPDLVRSIITDLDRQRGM